MADSILRLKVESQEYDAKLKRAAQGLQQYANQCRKAGGTLESVEKDTLDFVKAIGRMETVTKTAKGSLGEMTASFTQFKMIYKQMSDAEKQSPVGKAFAQSLDQLKSRIKETQRDLQDINKELQGGNGKFGQFGNVFDQLGSRMGVTGNITELLTSKTALLTGAIGASTTVIVAATKAWADYNSEIAKQQQITTVTTGLKGDDAYNMTASARALSKTYGVDFREAINAANTIMTQFGKSGDEAIQLLRDGMQGMIMGDGPKLLSMIQQYAPAFRDAGVSASQLVAVIQNSEGGIFTAENMNAIVMGIKNIRLMTKQTGDALAQIGIDGKEVTKALNDGTMTIFDALKLVAGQLKDVDSNSQAAGQVMQAVFGRQGAMAGTNLAKAIEGLNTNLAETKRQTGEVGQAYDELYQANVRLEQALQKTFGYKGWEEMSIGIKTKLITAMANVLELTNKINKAFENNFGVSFFEAVYNSATRALGPLGTMLRLLKDINKEKGDAGQTNGSGYSDMDKIFAQIKGGANVAEREKLYQQHLASINQKLANIGSEKVRKNADGSTSYYIDSAEVQQQKREALLRRRLMLINNYDNLIKGNPTAPTPEPFTPFTPTTKTTGSKSGKTDAQQEQELIDRIANQLATAQAKSNILVDQEFAAGKMVREMPSVYEMMLPEIQKQILDKQDFDLKKVLKEYVSDPDADKRKQKDINETDKFASDFSKITGSVSSIASGLQSLGVEIPEGLAKTISVMQVIAGILTGISTLVTIITAIQGTKSIPIIGWALARGGVVPNAENGYYVPGTRTSGDTTPILANAGELVLNKSSQSNLAAMIRNAESLVGMIDRYQNSFLGRTQYGNEGVNFSGGAMQNLKLSATVSGEQIRLVLNNNGRRTGRGEYVTTNFR